MEFSINSVGCDVVISHYNYSDHIETALQSVLNQTHRNFRCVIVDDASIPEHYEALCRIVERLGDPRVEVIRNVENVGQILSFYVAIRATGNEFVAFLDPDDAYSPDFLRSMLTAHLNPLITAAVATCNMGLFRTSGDILTRHYVRALDNSNSAVRQRWALHQSQYGYAEYFPPWKSGWIWATTSALMIRRDALELIAPQDFSPDTKAFGDTYCVQGSHMIGGSLFVDEVLSWRGLHSANTVESERLFSQYQQRQKDDFDGISKALKWAAFRSFVRNGGAKYLTPSNFGEIVTSHFASDELFKYSQEEPRFSELLIRYASNVR